MLLFEGTTYRNEYGTCIRIEEISGDYIYVRQNNEDRLIMKAKALLIEHLKEYKFKLVSARIIK